jgi:colicin import membrane protein
MNAALSYEPFKLPAGILALAVHLVFFSLLYFGFSWQNTPPEAISVDLWQNLPEPVVAPPEPLVQPRVIEAVQPAQPEKIIKADIVLPDKKKKIVVKPVTPKVPEIKKIEEKPLPRIFPESKPVESMPSVVVVDQQAVQAARELQEKSAANKRVVDEYIGKITNKIKNKVVEPPGVSKEARTEFLVTLLPGGLVLNVSLLKPSGNAAYDNAVERAILKSQPLPLPPDVAMFKNFRELKLSFEPEK